jgi:hypothetical protein
MAVNLKAVLGFDGKAYEAGMRKASGLAKKTSKNISSGLKGAIVGAMSVGYIAAKAKEVGEFAREVRDLAPSLGTTTDQLQEWEYVFARFGCVCYSLRPHRRCARGNPIDGGRFLFDRHFS